MSDELLPYYNRELAYIRRLGAEFAEAHPKIAGRLLLGADGTEDPHVERLIEAFAFLTARIRHKLDDDFPELSDSLLSVVYPHYLAPIPSMAIAQFGLDPGQGELTTGYTLPRGTAVEADSPDGIPCPFRTCYPTTVWPIEVVSATLTGRPFTAPPVPGVGDAAAVLRLELRCVSKSMRFAQLVMQSLRFHIKGQGQHVYQLYELLFNNAIAVAVADSAKDSQPNLLPRDCLRPVGFERDEGMLPYAARSFLGYRLLTEYFTFPQKFSFFDVTGLGPTTLKPTGTMELYVFLNRTTVDLERNVTGDMFRLGCAPIVNLYRHRAEPIHLNHEDTEYRVVVDARNPLAGEIYSVDRVTATSPDNEQVEFAPFYSFKHAQDRGRQKTFWNATRRPATIAEGQSAAGTEIYLSLVDLGFSPSVPANWTLDVETTCLSRDRPIRLPFGERQPGLRLTQGAPISRIDCLTRPTPTLRPAQRQGGIWRLVSHLSLNHLSLADADDGASALREILKLYDFNDSAETRAIVEGIASVATQRIVGRAPGEPRGGFCRGLEVRIHFDEERFAGSGVYLFASVLERFLGLYSNLNSFSRLIVTTNKRDGDLRRWPPRAGEKVLL
jgi:type VI secretion system protein ImpG